MNKVKDKPADLRPPVEDFFNTVDGLLENGNPGEDGKETKGLQAKAWTENKGGVKSLKILKSQNPGSNVAAAKLKDAIR